jgi:hypothetical protein
VHFATRNNSGPGKAIAIAIVPSPCFCVSCTQAGYRRIMDAQRHHEALTEELSSLRVLTPAQLHTFLEPPRDRESQATCCRALNANQAQTAEPPVDQQITPAKVALLPQQLLACNISADGSYTYWSHQQSVCPPAERLHQPVVLAGIAIPPRAPFCHLRWKNDTTQWSPNSGPRPSHVW